MFNFDFDNVLTGYTTKGTVMRVAKDQSIDPSVLLFERDRRRWREHACWAVRSMSSPTCNHFRNYATAARVEYLINKVRFVFGHAQFSSGYTHGIEDNLWISFAKEVENYDVKQRTDFFGALFQGAFSTVPHIDRTL